jgi:hypothetical protein
VWQNPAPLHKITTMVRKIILSEYISNPPFETGRVKIDTKGPIYDLALVQKIVRDETKLSLLTRKCQRDVHSLFDSDFEKLTELIQALTTDDYLDSEWCENGANGLAACDAYRLRRNEHIASADKSMSMVYYLKLAIGKTGHLVLLVSCHVC